MSKVAVIGLDGCSWDLLEPWIAQGRLPTLSKIREQGIWGDMESCLPPVTSPNWQCYATGLNPGQLGVFWWENVDFRAHRINLAHRQLFHGTPVWDILGDAGHRVLVVNFPTVYPPSPVNGALIAGGPDALDHDFVYPAQLEGELKRDYSYRVHSSLINFIDDPSRQEQVAADIHRIIRSRFEVTGDLLEKFQPDFLHLTIYYINVLQHHFWDHPVVLEAWEIIDAGIAKLMEALPDWNFLFMVDHGTNQIRVKFNISTWLQRRGYLTLHNQPSGSLLARMGVNRERAGRWAARLGAKDTIKRLLGPGTATMLPSEGGIVRVEAREKLIDWEKSLVIASGQGPVYVNPGIPGPQRSEFIDSLQQELEALTDDTGYRLCRKVYRKEEVYVGEFMEQAPDLVIDQNDGVHITPSIGFKESFEKPQKWLAENHRVGMFGAIGQDFGQEHLSRVVSILDLAPTILHLYGITKPDYMAGRVIDEALLPDSASQKNAGSTNGEAGSSFDGQLSGLTPEEEEIITQRLRSLGYI